MHANSQDWQSALAPGLCDVLRVKAQQETVLQRGPQVMVRSVVVQVWREHSLQGPT